MQKTRYLEKIIYLGLFTTLLISAGTVAGTEEKETAWDQAGQEVKEAAGEVKDAAGAVKDATKETSKGAWEKTRDESRQIYHRAREESGEAWQKTRQTSESVWDSIRQETRETWIKLREESKEALKDAKGKIHEATAPQEPGEPAPAEPEQE